MRFSVTIFLTDQTIDAVEMAREVEARGFHALYLPEHTHIPSSRATPAPMGEPLPHYYSRCVDPFVTFGAMAAVTERIRLGTGVCLLAQRDPIVTAKEVSTLDRLSGGRFTFGVGVGWNVEEAADHGVDWPSRRELVRDKLLAMRQLWTHDEAQFNGEHVQLPPSWQWPKPVQQTPPLWLGLGAGPRNFRLIAELADGWIPIGGRGMAAALPDLRRTFEEAGRDMTGFDVVPFGSAPDRGKFEYFATLGVTEVVAYAPSGTRDEVLPFLDHYAGVVEDVGG